MDALWFQALTDTDAGLAEALAPHKTVAPVSPSAQDGEAKALALEWLTGQFPIPNVLVLAGTGQVDLIEPLLKGKEELRLLLLERDAVRLVAALNGVDSPTLADAIRNERLLLDIGESETRAIERFLTVADFSRVPRIKLLEARPLSDKEHALAVEMTKAAREHIRLDACLFSTNSIFAAEWQTHTLRNLPRIVKERRIRSLFGRFKGMPGLVVGAGPSLDDALPYIKTLVDRFVIISTGRALNRLLQCGIRPDLLVTGDSQQLVQNHFKRKPDGLPVVASVFTHPELVDGLDRIFFMELDAVGFPQWLRDRIGETGEIHPGGNVATAAMSVAIELGCGPVLTVGFDLSYTTDGKTHATGKAGTGLEPDRIYYDVPGNYQPIVRTNRQMWHYIQFAQEYVAARPEISFVNVNTGGARIEGMQLVKPEALETFAGKPINAGATVSRVYVENTDATDTEPLCDTLRNDVELLRSLRDGCMKAAMISNRLIMVMRCPSLTPDAEQVVRSYLADLEPLDERIKSDPIMNLIQSRLEKVSQLLAERLLTAEEQAQSPAVRSHWRWREYYKGVMEACQTTERLLIKAIACIEQDQPASIRPLSPNMNPQPEEVPV